MAHILPKLDLRNACDLIRVKERHEYLTAFGIRNGEFECAIILFGLTNCKCAALFSRFMNDFFQIQLPNF